MRKLIFTSLIWILYFSSAFNQSIDETTIRKVAINAFSMRNPNVPRKSISITERISILDSASNVVMVVINFNSGGYAIVSNEKRTKPILAISEKGKFNLDSIPPAFRYLLDRLRSEIVHMRKNNVKVKEEVSELWTK